MLRSTRNMTMAIGFVTTFPMFLALMFAVNDIDTILNSNLPSLHMFYQITESRGVATFMMCWVIVLYYSKYHWETCPLCN